MLVAKSILREQHSFSTSPLFHMGSVQIAPTTTGGVVQGGPPRATNEMPLRSGTSIAGHKTHP